MTVDNMRPTPINHKFKRRWVAALRGGNWEQVRDKEANGVNGRCALAVAGEVIKEMQKEAPQRIFWWDLGINNIHKDTIIHLNDFRLLNFPEIADYIEARF